MGTLGLPEAFLARMQAMLGNEYEAFLHSYEEERSYGLRRNPLKSDSAEFEAKMPFLLKKIPWAQNGYFCNRDAQPGKHVLHEAGAYYIQEPSAMAVADLLKAKPGECICDLCAAPGGKSTQLAGWMQGKGLLVSNEIIPSRARILSQNMERLGVRNCVVLNEDTERMAEQFPQFFHGIIVDAPCSGEGMFRKNSQACEEWSEEQVAVCADRQLMILENADRMLLPGGRMIYSTCTFAPQENEGVLVRFLRKHSEYRLIELPACEGMEHGRADWVSAFGGVPDFAEAESGRMHLEYSLRLWPHRLSGEGHFIAGLYKEGDSSGRVDDYVHAGLVRSKKTGKNQDQEMIKGWENFADEVLAEGRDTLQGTYVIFGDYLYLVPEQMRTLNGLKVERAGLALGQWKKNRFEPDHALAMALRPEDTKYSCALTKEETERYLHGEAIPCMDKNGWVLMSYEGYSLGWGKASGNMAKNHYPKGLRIQG